ncbi:unnamed protein product [Vitrella brassicaformis CCMP3155]|uniref:Cyclic nucleotide-binding domain-containing protein n=1 Tax=Vitrella brassicaformis (strain CCMP3155) TaxID=1169540 RepID=A0A0G4EEQ4_VITBC|nr:unnamed protein product [Vitrella brassicaformis CCMP3155]|eukprot:CEL94166.1 unnamed protein product [Vitrella brassicaformis CCMP3155]
MCQCSQRRTGVSAEAVTKERMAKWKKPVYPKAEADKAKIRSVINTKLQVLFGHLDDEAREAVIDAMFRKEVKKGEMLIQQGQEGDNFYVVDKGMFDILVARGNNPPKKVTEAAPGSSFGELALMYNAPRAATCIAAEDSVVWALDRDSFQMMLVTAENVKKKAHESFLENVEIFQALTKLERGKLSDLLQSDIFEDGECIIQQGTVGDRFYIVEEGHAVAKLSEENKPEIVVKEYGPGGYFGEIALLADVSRKASVYAKGDCSVLWIDRECFDRVLGPIKDTLLKEVEKYPKYEEFLK